MIVRFLFDEVASAVELTHVERLSDALRVAADHDCALLDLGLPDATGLEGLTRLRAAAGDLAILVLTGNADEGRGSQALAAGAQDYLVKGQVDGDRLSRAVRYAVERRRAEAAQRELALARLQEAETARLERGLLPTPLVSDPGVGVATRYRAGRRSALLGGDFYDVVEDSGGCLRAVIGDVSGHGPDEAAVGVCLRVAWRTLVMSGAKPDTVLPTLQSVLEVERHHRSVFATLAAVDIEPDRSSITLRTAGHPAPLLLTGGGAEPLADEVGGPPLGVVDQVAWAATRRALAPGDAVLLFTDGIVEGRRADGERVGVGGLSELILAAGRGSEALQTVVDRAEELNQGPLRDDIALVLLEL
ncbi:MAG: hypothetical protein QOF76_2752 [Solirubrobacteraceae bacterium]|jgi:serine phosphatase RsbU (regulator of sigma subunit)|nr:hypothetical protein [Solirubrobacteraceae bacterium]